MADPANAADSRLSLPCYLPLFGVAFALLLLSGGCAGDRPRRIQDAAEFDELLRTSDKPVLVDFYKGGCPTCVPLDPKMDQLTQEYQGRVIVAKFKLQEPYYSVTSQTLMDRYDIHNYPTVILFVRGQPYARIFRDYDLDHYRQAINSALAERSENDSPRSSCPNCDRARAAYAASESRSKE